VAEQSGAYPETPASTDDVRALRRWLIVVAVWAVAASAIGIIALIASGDDNSGNAAATNVRFTELERSLSGQIQSLEDQVSQAAKSDDIAKLDSRLKDVRKEVADAKEASDSAKKTADELDSRVEDLEKRADDLEQNKQDKK
jgi:septal ring factor EnvC (AmiA/AmiB activator)